jgi:CO/xanthine dehydrogenase Mo-binding subunit
LTPIRVNCRGHYTADIAVAGLLHARMVTSLYAHANVKSIDSAAAPAVPGVGREAGVILEAHAAALDNDAAPAGAGWRDRRPQGF